jgi:hypothetical protein
MNQNEIEKFKSELETNREIPERNREINGLESEIEKKSRNYGEHRNG